MERLRLIKYLIGLFLILIGIGVLIGGIIINNISMILIGIFTLVCGSLVSLFIYMNP